MIPLWFDIHSGEPVDGPHLPEDLTDHRAVALEAMDLGLVRWRGRVILETTAPVKDVLAMVRSLFPAPEPDAPVVVNNLRTGESYHTSIREMHRTPAPPSVKPALDRRHPFDYELPDIFDAATLQEQHHAVYGAWLRRDRDRLNLDDVSKTLTFSEPSGQPHIRWVTRQLRGDVHRPVPIFLVAGWTESEALDRHDDSHPVAWAPGGWIGSLLYPQKQALAFDDPDVVAEHFGYFDMAEVNSMRILAAWAHGWNPLPVPRAWENVKPSLFQQIML